MHSIKFLVPALLCTVLFGCGSDNWDSPDIPSGPCRFNSQCGIGFLCMDGGCYYFDAGPFIPGKDGGGSSDGGGGPDGSTQDGGIKDGGTASCALGTCQGCCNAYNTCYAGTLDTACGENNATCQDCTQVANYICKNHKCINKNTLCAYTSCTGCCDVDDVCQKGVSNTQCGNNGTTCMDCTLYGETCKLGGCSM